MPAQTACIEGVNSTTIRDTRHRPKLEALLIAQSNEKVPQITYWPLHRNCITFALWTYPTNSSTRTTQKIRQRHRLSRLYQISFVSVNPTNSSSHTNPSEAISPIKRKQMPDKITTQIFPAHRSSDSTPIQPHPGNHRLPIISKAQTKAKPGSSSDLSARTHENKTKQRKPR